MALRYTPSSYRGTAPNTVEVEQEISSVALIESESVSPGSLQGKLCPGFVYFHGGKAVEPLSLERSSKSFQEVAWLVILTVTELSAHELPKISCFPWEILPLSKSKLRLAIAFRLNTFTQMASTTALTRYAGSRNQARMI